MRSEVIDQCLIGTRKLYLGKFGYTTTHPFCTTRYTRSAGESRHSSANDAKSRSQRNLFLDILQASATRRDAKQFLARVTSQTSVDDVRPTAFAQARAAQKRRDWQLARTGVNCGLLYKHPMSVSRSPPFTASRIKDTLEDTPQNFMHVTLAVLKAPETINDETLRAIASTLSQLVRLDMHVIVLLDITAAVDSSLESVRHSHRRQANRVTKALDRQNVAGARYVDGAIAVQSEHPSTKESGEAGQVDIVVPELILDPLERNVIPVMSTLAYDKSCTIVEAALSQTVLALTQCLSGLTDYTQRWRRSGKLSNNTRILDRLILIDSVGGVPSTNRRDRSHAFINLEHELSTITSELENIRNISESARTAHMRNLTILRECLALLSPDASALIVSPEEAASSSEAVNTDGDMLQAKTRRPRNALIHNLLTNRPMVSSSLPEARMLDVSDHTDMLTALPSSPTLVKRGMPLLIVPDPSKQSWTPKHSGEPGLDLEKTTSVNLSRTLALIEDSFRRKLSLKHYLSRIRRRLAGVVIAGEYEGGAILTWETPSNVSSTSPREAIPYLDKFAVAQRSQGSSGVADIVFQAIVGECFPNGVVWRSRQSNPVNKWYFERCKGSWKLPGGQWTMFWTTEGVEHDPARWQDYVDVCGNIAPSWADGVDES